MHPKETVTIKSILEQVSITQTHVDKLRAMLRIAERDMNLSKKLDELDMCLALLTGENTAELAKPESSNPPVQKPVRPAPSTSTVTKPVVTKPPAARPKTITPPAYDSQAMKTIVNLPKDWTEAKCRSVRMNPNIHPDSIGSNGLIRQTPWTWTAISRVLHDGHLKTVAELSKDLCLPEDEIRQLLVRMDITEKKPEIPEFNNPPVNAENKATSLERYLPEFAKRPPLRSRIQILRYYAGLSCSELAKAAGIGNGNFIKQLEGGDRIVTGTHLSRLNNAFKSKLPDVRQTERPLDSLDISKIIPLDNVKSPQERVRRIRCRMSLSEREVASRLDITESQYINLENTCSSRAVLDKLVTAMHIDTKILDDICEEPSGRKPDTIQTGLNIEAMMKARGIDKATVCSRLKILDTHLNSIVSGNIELSLPLTAAMSELFGCDTNAFYAVIEP